MIRIQKCKACGYIISSEKDEKNCPACGSLLDAKIAEPPMKTKEVTSAEDYTKWADILDDNTLLRLGYCKKNGIGMEKDEEQAFVFFRTLAYRGNLDGMYQLALNYLEQTPPNRDSAIYWLKTAADEGHVPSGLKLKEIPEYRDYKAAKSGAGAGVAVENASGLQGLIERALPRIVAVTAESDSKKSMQCGTGFIIEGGFVITNAHVVGKHPSRVTACFENGVDDAEYELIPISIRPDYDIAVLYFKGLKAEEVSKADYGFPLRIEEMSYGEEVYTIGNPLGLGLSVGRGIVSSPARQINFRPRVETVIQADMTINHGNSGGPLLDKQNNVVGIITFIPTESKGGIAMSVPAKYIVEVLNEI